MTDQASIDLRFLTWNLNWQQQRLWPRRVELLRTLPWDVAALQEVKRPLFNLLVDAGLAAEALCSLDVPRTDGGTNSTMGCVLLARRGRLTDPRHINGSSQPERTLVADLHLDGHTLEVASWHAPNAAGRSREFKMQSYRALEGWMRTRTGPTVVGADVNAGTTGPTPLRPGPSTTTRPGTTSGAPSPANATSSATPSGCTSTPTPTSSQRSHGPGPKDPWRSPTTGATPTRSPSASTASSSPPTSPSEASSTATTRPSRLEATTPWSVSTCCSPPRAGSQKQRLPGPSA